ncbi:SUKH-4 family immunity protein [Streptomyces sp. NBC_00663]|uniref:SUKH-4 family immunity protein n=1 Tax=Streptomyces sp. NBC_00663 TaxID=2975801 RepID=UPI002E3789CB|nr:SUKH-4 family immunity protein [Streptomyces sp. NBC_00663]
MLFDVSRSQVADIFGKDRIATLPASAFPPATANTEGARLLERVGIATGTLWLREPDEDTGRLPLLHDVVNAEHFVDAPVGAGEWPVVGWLLNAHLALDPVSGKVYAVDNDDEIIQELHTDVSSLVHVTVQVQRLLEEFTFSGGNDGDEEADFERLKRETERIRHDTSSVDPLPFEHDETVWWVVCDELAAGQRFRGDSPGARSLYG